MSHTAVRKIAFIEFHEHIDGHDFLVKMKVKNSLNASESVNENHR